MWRLARVLLAVVVGMVVTAPAASAAPDHESRPAPDRQLATLLGELWETVLETPVPDNPLAAFTTAAYGFSDAAEGFVLIAGISAGLVFLKRFETNGTA